VDSGIHYNIFFSHREKSSTNEEKKEFLGAFSGIVSFKLLMNNDGVYKHGRAGRSS